MAEYINTINSCFPEEVVKYVLAISYTIGIFHIFFFVDIIHLVMPMNYLNVLKIKATEHRTVIFRNDRLFFFRISFPLNIKSF